MNSPQSALKSSESDKNQKETNIQNNPSNKAIELIVRNLNYDTSEDKLRHLFTSIGQVNAVSIPVTFGRGRGYGFVTMEDEESANKCIQQLDGTEVDSRSIHIEISKNQNHDQINENNKAEIEVDDFIIPDLVREELKNAITSSMTDKDKEKKLKQILEQLKIGFEQNQQKEFDNQEFDKQQQQQQQQQQQKKQNQLLVIFNQEMCNLIQSHINNLSTPVELILLDIVEFVAEFGILINDQNLDPIYNIFLQSGFIIKIEEILKKKVIEDENQNKEKIFSEIVIQLTRIYLYIKKGQFIDNMIDICIKVMDKNVNILFNGIKSKMHNNEEIIIKKEDDHCIDNELEQLSRSVQIAELINWNHYFNNNNNLKLFHERITPLIHFNCPTELNCQLRNTIPSSPALQQLQSTVYKVINNTCARYNYIFKQIIMNEHNIIYHLTPLIFSFEYTNQLNNNKDQQLSTQQYPQNVSVAWNLIKLLLDTNDYENNQASTNKDFIASHIQIIQFRDEMKNTILSSLIDKDKEKKLKYLLQELKEINKLQQQSYSQSQSQSQAYQQHLQAQQQKQQLNQLVLIFDIEMCNLIKNHINNLSTPVEFILVDILEYVIETEQKNHRQYNILFDKQQSELQNIIEQLINNKFEEEQNKNKCYSDKLIQLVRMYLKLINESYDKLIENDSEYYDVNNNCKSETFGKCINILELIFKDFRLSLQNQKDSIINQEYNQKIQNMTKLIGIVGQFKLQFVYCQSTCSYTPKQIFEVIKSEIIPLFHINCGEELNCLIRINIQNSPIIQDLQIAIYQVLIDKSDEIFGQNNILITDHNMISHFFSLFTSFTQTNSNNENKFNFQNSIAYPSPLLISFALNTLYYIFQNDNNNIIQSYSTNNNISLLIKMYKQQLYQQINSDNKQIQSNIIIYCRSNLGQIIQHSNQPPYDLILQEQYIQLLCQDLAIRGGQQQENNNDIYYTLQVIEQFFKSLHQGQQDGEIRIQPQQYQLIHSFEEQIELEGGNQEIESFLTNNEYNQGIKYTAHQGKNNILNAFLDPTNSIHHQ